MFRVPRAERRRQMIRDPGRLEVRTSEHRTPLVRNLVRSLYEHSVQPATPFSGLGLFQASKPGAKLVRALRTTRTALFRPPSFPSLEPFAEYCAKAHVRAQTNGALCTGIRCTRSRHAARRASCPSQPRISRFRKTLTVNATGSRIGSST
jgi:hypothetical protein